MAGTATSISKARWNFFDPQRREFKFLAAIGAASGLHRIAAMKEPSPARKRTEALHARAIKFATDVNQLYPKEEMNYPSRIVWEQLVRAADSASNNLIEAGNGSSDADFLNKLRLALREAKESRACLTKIRLAPLQNAQGVIERGLEQEADELCAIFATIIINMELRLAEERDRNERRRRR